MDVGVVVLCSLGMLVGTEATAVRCTCVACGLMRNQSASDHNAAELQAVVGGQAVLCCAMLLQC